MMNANSTHRDHSVIQLQNISASSPKGRLILGHQSWFCMLGKNGYTTHKREGDMSTPTGALKIQNVMYRPDRVARPRTSLPVQALKPSNGWCDALGDRNYNRAVKLPYPTSHEKLWREDRVYDICIVLDYNIMPRKSGHGSAIFFHLTAPDHRPTEGCIAVDYPDMVQILKQLKPSSFIKI